MYLLLLGVFGEVDVGRTDMERVSSLLYKQNCTTTVDDWKRMLNPQKTYIFYDGFCVPKGNRDRKQFPDDSSLSRDAIS